MEESAQNLGAHGFRLFRRIVFPLAMPGYVAGAALVFVKVFDDLGTPLLLNVTNMLAPQAYLRITSVGIDDPMGYVISRDHDRRARSARMWLSARVAEWPRLRHRCSAAAAALRGGRSTAGKRVARVRLVVAHAGCSCCRRTSASCCCRSRRCGRFSRAARRLHARPLRHRVRDSSDRMIGNTLLYCGLAGADRRRARRRDRLPRAAHAAARPRSWLDWAAIVGAGDPRRRARHRLPARLLRRRAAVSGEPLATLLVHARARLRGAPPALRAALAARPRCSRFTSSLEEAAESLGASKARTVGASSCR